jgi:two-component system chemotaxis response regulator CheY
MYVTKWSPAASWSCFDEKGEKTMTKILVVDDSSTVRDEVAGFLKKHGLAVDTAVDGKDGLAKIKANPGVKLVISDVNMPNMDGLTMVEKVRGELGNKTVNVIMLTTESSPAMKDRGRAAGVKGWIVKPFKGDAVLETFKKLAS